MASPNRSALLIVPCALLLGACYAPSHVVKVRHMVQEGDYERALYQTRRSLKDSPDDRELWKLLLHIHFAQGQRKEAVAAYRKKASGGRADRQVARYLGLLLMRWAMEHKEPAVRLDAVQGARRTDAAPLAPDMGQRLADDDAEVRTWAAVAMSRSRQGADVLEEQLTSTSHAARAIAVEQVGRIAGCKAVTALLPHVKDSHQQVRAAAARALAHCKRKEMLPHLEALLSDSQWQVQAAAARATASLGYRQGTSALTPLLQHKQVGVRLAVMDALAALDQAVARPLLEKMVAERTWLTALRAGVLLARAGKAQPGLEAVARALVAGKPTDRAAACNAASQIKDAVAADQAKKALGDADALVRLAAGRALAAHKRGAEALEMSRALHGKACPAGKAASTDLCLQAAELLALLGQPAGAVTLTRLAREAAGAPLRRRALSVALRHRSSRDLALAAMADDDARVAVAGAVWLYGQLK